MSCVFPDRLFVEFSVKNDVGLDKYKPGSKKKVWWTCKDCKHEWISRIQHRTTGSGCPVCKRKLAIKKRSMNRPSILETHTKTALEWCDPADINLISSGCNKSYQWQCQKCQMIFLASPNNRCNLNTGCPYCSGRYVTELRSLEYQRPDLAKEMWDNIYAPSQLCCNSNKLVQWKCSKCNHLWKSTVNNRFRGRGCPKCCLKNSRPQREIEQFLIKSNTNYKTEFRFADCKNIRPLPFDFAILDNTNSVSLLLEYQGEQHYFPIWGSCGFNRTIQNDKIKLDYCKSKSIPLILIPYWEKHKIGTISHHLSSTN